MHSPGTTKLRLAMVDHGPCIVRPLEPEDFIFIDGHDSSVSDPDGQVFSSFVQITCIVGDLTQKCLRGDLTHKKRLDLETALLRWLDDLPAEFHLHDRTNGRLNSYSFRSRQLHVPYFVALIILSRQRSPEKCPPPVALLAASFIIGIFEEYLDWGDIAVVSPASIFYLMVASLVQASAYRFAAFARHREKEFDITRQAVDALKTRFPTAIGAERVIQYVSAFTVQVPSDATSSETISMRERKFFSVFGPELCCQWEEVMNPPPEPPRRTARSNNPLSQGSQQQAARHEADFGQHASQNMPGSGEPDTAAAFEPGPWNMDPLLQFNGAGPQLFNGMGQWWWSDMVSGHLPADF
ncbi:uncharacterized protein LTR77_005780 [Saxophila tyrrhenica]|uniref:Uncharacterized protein n=1 Tax=Saxophila tyrrhenica TaxID=1690608 RepID=A0AAV9PDI1_9PEZI|nr:hypothetical protein LTR77_005780 [Saxophila tyrrhenica]